MTDANSLKQLFNSNKKDDTIPFEKILPILEEHFGIKELSYLTEVMHIISENLAITEDVFGELIYTYINSDSSLPKLAFYAADSEKKQYLTNYEFEALCMKLQFGLTEKASKELWELYSTSNQMSVQQFCECYNNLLVIIQ